MPIRALTRNALAGSSCTRTFVHTHACTHVCMHACLVCLLVCLCVCLLSCERFCPTSSCTCPVGFLIFALFPGRQRIIATLIRMCLVQQLRRILALGCQSPVRPAYVFRRQCISFHAICFFDAHLHIFGPLPLSALVLASSKVPLALIVAPIGKKL